MGLDELIKQRIAQAEARNLTDKAWKIGIFYDGRKRAGSWLGNYSTSFSWANSELQIQLSCGRIEGMSLSDGLESLPYSRTEIMYKGRTVFKEGGGKIRSYIPGESCKDGNWEKDIEALYATTPEGKAELEAAANRKITPAEKAEMEKWGL